MENILLLVFVALAVLIAVVVLIKSKGGKLTEKDQRFFIVKWQEVLNVSGSDPRHAILDADKLLDHLLSKRGYSGSLGEKLKQSSGMFTNIDAVWSAHKVRNRIAHELDFDVSQNEAKFVLGNFKRALQDLGIKL